MQLIDIELLNFRCFEKLTVTFQKQLNVIVGNNGAGKSTILDAVSVAIGTFLTEIEGVAANGIRKEDVLYRSFQIGSTIELQSQYPAVISGKGVLNNQEIKWKRSINSENGRTIVKEAKQMTSIASKMQSEIRKGNISVILPVLSYYGTGRLWAQKKEKKKTDQLAQFKRVSGYIDCLDSASNEKMMMRWFEKMTLLELQRGEKIPELQIVKQAIAQCFNSIEQHNCTNVIFNLETNALELICKDEKNGSTRYLVNDMSDGYKNTLSMIADIAYRMAVLNPQLLEQAIIDTPGIVLIDEVDLHLHPSWQQKILKDLTTIFPKVQFIVTTHAPAVIQSVSRENLIIVDKNAVYSAGTNTYGRDANAILREIMDVNERPLEVKELFVKFYQYIEDHNLDLAKSKVIELEEILGISDTELVSAKITLDLESM